MQAAAIAMTVKHQTITTKAWANQRCAPAVAPPPAITFTSPTALSNATRMARTRRIDETSREACRRRRIAHTSPMTKTIALSMRAVIRMPVRRLLERLGFGGVHLRELVL